MDEAIAYGQKRGVDTRQGSIFYDAVVGHCIRTAKFYEDLTLMADLLMLDTATEELLDMLGKEHGMERNSAIFSKWTFQFAGTEPDRGARFLVGNQYFTISKEDQDLFLTAEIAGSNGNDIATNASAVPMINIEGLVYAKIGEIVVYGVDTEGDEEYRQRVKEKVGGGAENGNKQHYKTWCEEISGVGRAKIYPLWAGENTVKAVIYNAEGMAPLESLVHEVQNHIDPITRNYTVEVDGVEYIIGDGLGEGAANLGAHFIAVGAVEFEINISFNVICKQGGTIETVEDEVTEALTKEFTKLVLEGEDVAEIIIRYTMVGFIISGCDSVLDYSDLLVNGGNLNVSIGIDSVPILGEVSANAG